MAIETRKTWGTARLQRIHTAWAVWRSRHPGVYSEPYANASEDAGAWCACVRLFTRHPDGRLAAGASDPIGKAYDHEHPNRQATMDAAVLQFEEECASK